jgi:hypothetical protein
VKCASQQQAFLRGQSSQREKATQYSPLNGVVADIPAGWRVRGIATFVHAVDDHRRYVYHQRREVDETEIASVDVGRS